MSLQNTHILYQGCSFPLLSEKAGAEFIDQDESTCSSDQDSSAQGSMFGWMDGWIFKEGREGWKKGGERQEGHRCMYMYV